MSDNTSTSERTNKNTDVEIWRETEGDYYAPSIHKTENGKIGIDVGGLVFVADVRDWHDAMAQANDQEKAGREKSDLMRMVRCTR